MKERQKNYLYHKQRMRDLVVIGWLGFYSDDTFAGAKDSDNLSIVSLEKIMIFDTLAITGLSRLIKVAQQS